MAPARPRVSILVVNWNTEGFLRECARSVIATCSDLTWEMIVVDNNSADGSIDLIHREFNHDSRVKLIVNSENVGFARANNQAYSYSTGAYVLLLNPDTKLQSQALQHMLAYSEAHPEVGIVGCKFLNPDGSLQRHYRRFPTFSTVFFCFTRPGRALDAWLFRDRYRDRYYTLDLDFESVVTCVQPSATCLLIGRRVISAIGGLFDEAFPLLFNDVDLCRRVVEHGFQIHVIPQAHVVHYGASSLRQLHNSTISYQFFQGVERYFQKHYDGSYGTLVAVKVIVWFELLYARWKAMRGRQQLRHWENPPAHSDCMAGRQTE